MVRLMRDTKKQMVEEWNKKYRVGQKVKIKLYNTTIETITSSPAVLVGGHSPVIQLQGVSGSYALDKVTPVTSEVANAI